MDVGNTKVYLNRKTDMMIHNIETERADLFDVSILVAMKIHINGNVTEAELRDAFEKAVAAHEILNTRVCIEPDGRAYYRGVDSYPEQDNAGLRNNRITFEDTDWKDIIKREEKKRFRIETGEFLKAFVFEYDPEGCGILFLMHHLGGDGKSLVYFIETFMKALSGEKPRFTEMKLIPAGDLKGKDSLDRLGPLAFIPKLYNKRWEKDEKRRSFTFKDSDAAYEEYWSKRESSVNEYVISPEMVSKILTKCRAWNIGFTAYITTAFLRKSGHRMDIGFAVDAREDGNRCMGNQATGISIKCTYDKKKSFRDNAVHVQELMDRKLEDKDLRNFILPFMASFEPTLVDAINLEHAGTFRSKTSKKLADILGYGKKTKNLSITNLTKLDIRDTYGGLKIDQFTFVPPVISYGKNILGISTLGDCTVMTLHRVKEIC